MHLFYWSYFCIFSIFLSYKNLHLYVYHWSWETFCLLCVLNMLKRIGICIITIKCHMVRQAWKRFLVFFTDSVKPCIVWRPPLSTETVRKRFTQDEFILSAIQEPVWSFFFSFFLCCGPEQTEGMLYLWEIVTRVKETETLSCQGIDLLWDGPRLITACGK